MKPGSLPLHRGETTHNAADEAVDLITRQFPVYATGAIIEVASALSGPEEIAAFELLAASKGLIVRAFQKGGKLFFKVLLAKRKMWLRRRSTHS